jgi:branched-chain amino acid transport system ATP-binding protein
MTALLQLDDVTVRFGGVQAVSGITMALQPGEVVAVLGPNGAGKTSLLNAISGFVSLSAGQVALRGQRIDTYPPHRISALGVRRTFQNGGLANELSVLENILAGLHAEIHCGFLAAALGLRSAKAAEQAAIVRARGLLQMMQVGHLADQPAGELSGGQRRIVEILRALATSPPLLLLDEPAVGLSPPMRTQLAEVIRGLAHRDGIAILLVEHAIELVMEVSDRIVVLNNGEKIADGPPDQVRRDVQVLEAYLGHT